MQRGVGGKCNQSAGWHSRGPRTRWGKFPTPDEWSAAIGNMTLPWRAAYHLFGRSLRGVTPMVCSVPEWVSTDWGVDKRGNRDWQGEGSGLFGCWSPGHTFQKACCRHPWTKCPKTNPWALTCKAWSEGPWDNLGGGSATLDGVTGSCRHRQEKDTGNSQEISKCEAKKDGIFGIFFQKSGLRVRGVSHLMRTILDRPLTLPAQWGRVPGLPLRSSAEQPGSFPRFSPIRWVPQAPGDLWSYKATGSEHWRPGVLLPILTHVKNFTGRVCKYKCYYV